MKIFTPIALLILALSMLPAVQADPTIGPGDYILCIPGAEGNGIIVHCQTCHLPDNTCSPQGTLTFVSAFPESKPEGGEYLHVQHCIQDACDENWILIACDGGIRPYMDAGSNGEGGQSEYVHVCVLIDRTPEVPLSEFDAPGVFQEHIYARCHYRSWVDVANPQFCYGSPLV